MYVQSVHLYMMLMLVFYCSSSRQRHAPLPSLLCASSTPRLPKLLLISCRQQGFLEPLLFVITNAALVKVCNTHALNSSL